MNEILSELGVAWLLLIAPGITDFEVEVLAKATAVYETIGECQTRVETLANSAETSSLHAWCEPYGGYKR